MAIQTDSPVAILGMHRSGTSCLAGSLQEAGLYLGNVNEDAPHNAKGNRENKVIMDFHDELLADNGGTWNAPPVEVRWSDERRRSLERIVASYPKDLVWGFKDPRSLLALDGWIAAVPALRFVGTFRHPTAVAQSLAIRDNFPIEFSFDLWLVYNERLLTFHEQFEFELVNYDDSDEEYQGRISTIAKKMHLPNGNVKTRFYDNSLRHSFEDPGVRLPQNVAATYARLLEQVK